MALTGFVPEIWSAKLLVALEKSLVYAAPGVVNRDYEGEISQAGDTVHVPSIADPTVGTYTAHTDITIEDVDDTSDALTITESKYFAFEVDDVEKRQSAIGGQVMPEQTRKAGYRLRDVADQFVAAKMAAAITAGNGNLIAEATYTSAQIYDLLVDLGVKLDEQNVPSEGRWAILTPAIEGLLLKDETRFVGAANDAAARTNGRIGRAAGFDLYKSNNVPDGPGAGAGKLVIAGNNSATSYAEQIASVEAARMEKRFGDLVKGLHLYGAHVFRPLSLVGADVITG